MLLRLIRFIVYLSVLSLIVSFADKQNKIFFEFMDNVYIVTFFEAATYLVLAIFILELCCFCIKVVSNLLKQDVLISNHAFHGDKESIEIIRAAEGDKIVLSRTQFDEAAILIVKAMSSITSGVMNEARRHLVALRNIIGKDAIIDILMLKIYKGEKNFDKMEELSQKLMQNEDIQLVGMKAALEAQMEKKEFTEALKTANQAFEVRQDLYWVLSSAFVLRAKNDDWSGAMEVLEAGIEKHITPEQKALRLKSVTLYELAKQALKEKDKTCYFKFITQALEENNKLVPAALDLAEYYVKNDRQVRKAERVLYNMWCNNPTYEIAMAYLKLFDTDTKAEKIQRMEKLALANSKRPSLNNIILAELYLQAKKYEKAKTECKIFLLKNPATQKIATIIEQLNAKQHKPQPKSSNLIQSLTQKFSGMSKNMAVDDCPKDFQWVCANCGHTSDKWTAICPQCSEVGRNYWHLYVDKETTSVEEI